MWCEIFLRLALAHVVGDFVFQTDKWCKKKLVAGLRGYHVYVHGLIVFVLSWGALWSWSAWWIAGIVGISHFIIDIFKKRNGLWPFVLDQLGHIVCLIVFGYIAYIKGLYSNICFDTYYVKSALLFLLNTKPANILIKLLLKSYSVNIGDESENNLSENRIRAGKLIGNIERWLIIIFILSEQYDAIGFLIAAKSIIRYKEGDTQKTEYVLAGTLLSVFFAVVSGILLKLYV